MTDILGMNSIFISVTLYKLRSGKNRCKYIFENCMFEVIKFSHYSAKTISFLKNNHLKEA